MTHATATVLLKSSRIIADALRLIGDELCPESESHPAVQAVLTSLDAIKTRAAVLGDRALAKIEAEIGA